MIKNKKFLTLLSFLPITLIACGAPSIAQRQEPIIIQPIDNSPVTPPPAGNDKNVIQNTKQRDPNYPTNTIQLDGYSTKTNAYETFINDYTKYLNIGDKDNPNSYIVNKLINEQYHYIYDHSMRIEVTTYDWSYGFAGRLENTLDYKSNYGTAWILDYELTSDGSYPLTWFIATNLHVIAKLNAGAYEGEESPIDRPIHKGGEKKHQKDKQEGVRINFAAKKTENPNETADPAKWYDVDTKIAFTAKNFLGDSLTLAQTHGLNYPPQPKGFEHHISDKTYTNYFKDFAVLEVTFKNEKDAKELTRNFANNPKYQNKKIKFLEKDLLDYSSDELKDYEGFVLGYPLTNPGRNYDNPELGTKGGSKGGMSINKRIDQYDTKHGKKLAIINQGNNYVNRWKQKMPGIFQGLGHPPLQWGEWITEVVDGKHKTIPGKENSKKDAIGLERFPVVYSFTDSGLEPGASGSMVINKNKEIVGIQWGYDGMRASLIDPLRSKGFQLNGQIIAPAYDLIYGGVKNQTKSYKDSIYRNKKDKITWLLGKIPA